MPDGYQCDRCDDFVETGRMGPVVMSEMSGPVHHVNVTPEYDGDDFEMYDYTLCPRCRDELINWVENYA